MLYVTALTHEDILSLSMAEKLISYGTLSAEAQKFLGSFYLRWIERHPFNSIDSKEQFDELPEPCA